MPTTTPNPAELASIDLHEQLENARSWANDYDPLNAKSQLARVNPRFLVALIEHAIATPNRLGSWPSPRRRPRPVDVVRRPTQRSTRGPRGRAPDQGGSEMTKQTEALALADEVRRLAIALEDVTARYARSDATPEDRTDARDALHTAIDRLRDLAALAVPVGAREVRETVAASDEEMKVYRAISENYFKDIGARNSAAESTWSEYVAGVVVAYLGGGVDDQRIKPIAGIIARRLCHLAASRATAEQSAEKS